IDPVLWGTLVFVNLQAAFLSPPVAMSAFYLKGVSPPHVTLNQIFNGMMPYMVVIIICMVIMYLWPGMTLWLPNYLYGGGGEGASKSAPARQASRGTDGRDDDVLTVMRKSAATRGPEHSYGRRWADSADRDRGRSGNRPRRDFVRGLHPRLPRPHRSARRRDQGVRPSRPRARDRAGARARRAPRAG